MLFLILLARYPTNKWVKLGTFHARDERIVQSFPLDEQLYAKYVKVILVVYFYHCQRGGVHDKSTVFFILPIPSHFLRHINIH